MAQLMTKLFKSLHLGILPRYDLVVDISIDTKTDSKKKKEKIMFKVSHFKYHVLRVTCHMSRVTCYLLETLTATATYHPPANSPIMHSRLVCTDPKPRKIQNPKNH